MGRRNTKADQILNEARDRITKALQETQAAEMALSLATAALRAHQENYEALKHALTPATRKQKTSKDAPAAQKEAAPISKALLCGICGQLAGHPDHDKAYLSAHDFEPPKSVARAGRKSRTRSASTAASESSTPSASIETETAIAAGAGD